MVDKPRHNPFVSDPAIDFESVQALSREEATRQVKLLREAIEYHDYLYYVEGEPIISDHAYDALFDRLQALEEEFDLVSETSPTQRVGGEPIDSLESVEHVTPMLSLDSSEEESEVREWDRRVRESVGEVEYSIEPKFDGVSIEVVYENGEFDRAVTRGDGQIGDDISHSVRTIRSVPLSLETAPDFLALRGEIYMPRSDFLEMNEERVQRGEDPFANPRNAAAGTLRQLDPSVVADRPLDIYFYDVLASSDELETQAEAFQLMRDLGVRVSGRNQIVDGVEEFIRYRDRLLGERDEMEVEADGVVGKVNDFELREQLGATARHPRWAFAYKFPARRGETTVQRIVVQVGRTGKLTPVALLDPVEVTGVTISRATLHNASIVEELGVTEGSRVKVERAGDVIPEIAEVVEASPETFSMPEECPVCGSDVVQEGEYHFCTAGMSCPAQLRRSLQHFCSRDAMDIEGIGEKIANELVETGLITSIPDLYSLSTKDLVSLESFAEKSARNLLAEIEDSKQPRRDRFIYALGIRHVGSERARQLATRFTLEELMTASKSELLEGEDIGPEVAESVTRFFANQTNRETVTDLLEAGVSPTGLDTGDEFTDLRFVFTGSVDGYSRSEITDLLERNGARVTSSVSSRTDYLVVGDNPGSTKLTDAEENDVEMIEAEQFKSRFLDDLE